MVQLRCVAHQERRSLTNSPSSFSNAVPCIIDRIMMQVIAFIARGMMELYLLLHNVVMHTATAKECGALDVIVLPADVTDLEQSRSVVEETVTHFNKELASWRWSLS
jgi:hypothetical protein